VAAPSADEARQVFAVRRMLEAEMVRAFVRQATPRQDQGPARHVAQEKPPWPQGDVAGAPSCWATFMCAWPN
jgi:DNA-binding GntR family transcriptional regulator